MTYNSPRFLCRRRTTEESRTRPINIEFPGDDRAIFRVGVFHSLAFHCKTLNTP